MTSEEQASSKATKGVSVGVEGGEGEEGATRSNKRRSRYHSVWTCVLCNTQQKNISHHMLATHKIEGDRRKELTRGCPRVVIETATGNVVRREEGSVDVDSLLAFDADAIDDDVTPCDGDLDDVMSASQDESNDSPPNKRRCMTLNNDVNNDVIDDVMGVSDAMVSEGSEADQLQGPVVLEDGKFML